MALKLCLYIRFRGRKKKNTGIQSQNEIGMNIKMQFWSSVVLIVLVNRFTINEEA